MWETYTPRRCAAYTCTCNNVCILHIANVFFLFLRPLPSYIAYFGITSYGHYGTRTPSTSSNNIFQLSSEPHKAYNSRLYPIPYPSTVKSTYRHSISNHTSHSGHKTVTGMPAVTLRQIQSITRYKKLLWKRDKSATRGVPKRLEGTEIVLVGAPHWTQRRSLRLSSRSFYSPPHRRLPVSAPSLLRLGLDESTPVIFLHPLMPQF